MNDLYDSLLNKVKLLDESLWERNVSHNDVKDWLDNFDRPDEQIQALYLLSHFTYFGSVALRNLLKCIYRDLYRYRVIKNIRKENSDTLDTKYIESEFEEYLSKTRFLGIGNPSESGQHLLYFFRQENKLAKDLFIQTHEMITRDFSGAQDSNTRKMKIKEKDIREYVFIDDFCGSGSQAVKYSNQLLKGFKTKKTDVKISYLMLFGTSWGLENIRNNTEFDYVDCVCELDETFRCFSSKSRYFQKTPSNIDRKKAEKLSRKYGKKLIRTICKKQGLPPALLDKCAEKNAHGFKDGQLLVGFDHNTPDNTLPIIWYDEELPWRPIFKRYNKKYSL